MMERRDFELSIQQHPDHYTATAFRGRGQFDRSGPVPTFDAAIAVAKELYRDRPVAIYAVRGPSHSHVANFDPTRREPMLHYVVTFSGAPSPADTDKPYYPKFEVQRFTSAEAAGDIGAGRIVLTGEADVGKCQTPFLIRAYNSLNRDKPVSRFATRGDGIRRVWTAIEAAGANTTVLSEPIVIGAKPTTAAKPTKPAKAPKAVKTPKQPKPAKAEKNYPVGTVAMFDSAKLFALGSTRARILELLDGKMTIAQIAETVHVTPPEVKKLVWYYSKFLGIGTTFDDKGRATAVYPGSKTYADRVRPEKVS